MFFGFLNIPAILQGYFNKIFVKKLNILVIVYVNHILIYTKDLGKLYFMTIR